MVNIRASLRIDGNGAESDIFVCAAAAIHEAAAFLLLLHFLMLHITNAVYNFHTRVIEAFHCGAVSIRSVWKERGSRKNGSQSGKRLCSPFAQRRS